MKARLISRTGAVAAAIALATAPATRPHSQTVSYVASVKLDNAPDARAISEYSPGGRFTATAITVLQLLRIAYRIQPYQLVGAPSWISTRRYDIAAKAENDPAQPVLLGALLQDRFSLAVHNEVREMPIFALVLARPDGKPGPRLIPSSFDCAAYRAGPHDPPEPGRTPNCGARINPSALSAKAIPMSQLAAILAPFVNRFTVDRTGLTSGFDVELTWTPEADALNAAPDAAASVALSIFDALEQQLGLKLISERGPVDVLVIDRLREPSGN